VKVSRPSRGPAAHRCEMHFRAAPSPLKRKDNSSRACGPRLRTACKRVAVPRPPVRAGIFARSPFASGSVLTHLTVSSQKLRTASPGAECLDPGTLLHFRLQAPPLNRCYYHQDRHQGRLQARSRATLPRHPRGNLHAEYLAPAGPERFLSPRLQRHQFSGLADSTGKLLRTS
jgi:hypothetical protein